MLCCFNMSLLFYVGKRRQKTFAGAKVVIKFEICKLFAKKSAIIIKEGTGCPIKSGVMDINIKRDNIPQ